MGNPNQKRTPGTFKSVQRELVDLVGGIEAAEIILQGRVRRAQIARYTSQGDADLLTHMPIDVVRTLERVAGAPIVTEFLATEAGAMLVPVTRCEQQAETYLSYLGAVGEKTGDLFRTMTGALADGVMTPVEAGENMAVVMHLTSSLAVLYARLAKVRDGVAE